MKILSAKQFYEADKLTIKNQSISSVELMERAGISCFNWLHKKLGGAPVPIHIFCGIGNNGGDGLVIARFLINHGYQVNTYIANFSDKRSKDFLINYDRIKESSNSWPFLLNSEKDFPTIKKDEIIVDALFGIGLNRPPEGWVKVLITYLNKCNAFIVSIDTPSGLYANEAIKNKDAIIKADFTLTFQTPKFTFFLPETAYYTKSFEVVDIGLDQNFIETLSPLALTFGKQEAQSIYKTRQIFDHKGTFGHSLILGGSYGKIGAVILGSKATLKVGAGIVTAYVPKCGYGSMQSSIPEVMVITDEDNDKLTTFNLKFKPSAIGIGPGMGTHIKTESVVKIILDEYKDHPIIIDADAINCISNNKELLTKIPENSILTPHPGELKRLIGPWNDDFHKIELAKKFSIKYQIILLIKGAYTLIINNNKVFINTSGNPGMATAGSGDVLTGMITGLLSQGYEPLNASLFGVYLHGIAGDIASTYLGYEAIIASDIIDNIGNAYLEMFKKDKDIKEEKE